MNTWAHIENCVTIAATAAVIIGGYALGADGAQWWALLLLFNLNKPSQND